MSTNVGVGMSSLRGVGFSIGDADFGDIDAERGG